MTGSTAPESHIGSPTVAATGQPGPFTGSAVFDRPIAIAKETSGNAKIGDCATTYAAQESCPPSCVFFNGGGCYAETGRIGKFVTSALNEATRDSGASALDVAEAEAAAIDGLTGTKPLRLHTVGDCATDEAARIIAAAAERYTARGGGPVWTYTHAWRTVSRASWGSVSVLASCETPLDVVLAQARGYATAIVVEEFEAGRRLHDGVLPCPAQTSDRACDNCRLCFNDKRLRDIGYSVGFEIHGIPFAVRQARQALRAPDDPHRRLTAEQRLRLELARDPSLTAERAAETLTMNPQYARLLIAHIRDGAEHPSVGRRRRYERRKAA